MTARSATRGVVLLALALSGSWSATARADPATEAGCDPERASCPSVPPDDTPAPTLPAPLPEPQSPAGPGETDGLAPWRPPRSVPGARDWLLLNSGEVLRGKIEYIRDEKVHFDSDELEDLDIDWDDVASFGLARSNTFRFGDDVVVTGTAGMRGGVIRIDTGVEVLEFARKDLFSMIEGELREINYWSLEGALGLTLRSGNSDQTDLSTRLEVDRETPLTRGILSFESAYSTVESDDVTNNSRLTGLFAYYVTTRAFLVAPIGEVYRDRVRNIDLRGTLAAGAGYDVVDRPRAEWTVLGGAGYQQTEYGHVEIGEDRTGEDAALLFYTKLELDPMKDVDWDTSYLFVAVVSDWDRTSHHLTSVLSFEVWGPLDLDVSFVWDRIERPAADPDGETPESDDLQLTVGISLEL